MKTDSEGPSSCSDRTIAIITATFICVVTLLTVGVIFFSLPSQNSRDRGQLLFIEKVPWPMPGTPVPLSGTFHLTQFDDNYEKYLLAMDIPHTAVPHIIAASETLVIETFPAEHNMDINMKTITNWVTREIQFSFNQNFTISYGKGANSGVLHNYCSRPAHHVIHCRSEEREKKWKFEFDLIFSRHGLVNNRTFITKNIVMKKIYQRELNS
eukprot:GFUD01027587.1.p1 GENE.GFUD01027587.1~~GFUD01027587.1.p1  ORF type:complete len:211 (-),score=42.39 GFUD01027587.1:163-795(-)